MCRSENISIDDCPDDVRGQMEYVAQQVAIILDLLGYPASARVELCYSDRLISLMELSTDTLEYRLYRIHVGPAVLRKGKAAISRTVLHELLHGLLAPLTGLFPDAVRPRFLEPLSRAEETVVSDLEDAFWRALRC